MLLSQMWPGVRLNEVLIKLLTSVTRDSEITSVSVMVDCKGWLEWGVRGQTIHGLQHVHS